MCHYAIVCIDVLLFYTPELVNVTFRWRVPANVLSVLWTIPENPMEKWQSFETYHSDTLLENAIDNPLERRPLKIHNDFRGADFLVCNMLFLQDVSVDHTCDGSVYGQICSSFCAPGYNILGEPDNLFCGAQGKFLTAKDGPEADSSQFADWLLLCGLTVVFVRYCSCLWLIVLIVCLVLCGDVYICIYIYRERERYIDIGVYIYICTYIYIYIHICIHIST